MKAVNTVSQKSRSPFMICHIKPCKQINLKVKPIAKFTIKDTLINIIIMSILQLQRITIYILFSYSHHFGLGSL